MSVHSIKVKDLPRKFTGRFAEINKLLPQRTEQELSFCVRGPAWYANALRRCILDELPARALSCTYMDTNDPEILHAEFCDRVSLLPVQQDFINHDADTVYTINIMNTSAAPRVVMSQEIKCKHVLPDFPIAVLNAHSYLRANMRIVHGMGYENACWAITGSVAYTCTDYVDVDFVNSRGNIICHRVAHSELPKSDKPILVIPDKAGWLKLENSNASVQRAKKYTCVFKKISPASSLNSAPQNWKLVVHLHGNCDALAVLESARRVLRERCTALLQELQTQQYEKIVITETLERFENKTVPVWTLQLHGETHTIAEMISQHCVANSKLFVKKFVPHPSRNEIHIKFNANAHALCTRALQEIIKMF